MTFYSILLSSLILQLATSEKYKKEENNQEKNMAKVSKSVINDIVERINKFNFNFDKTLAEDNAGNIIFSPFSIYTALAMLGVGAEGKTKKEIASVLESTDFPLLLNNLAPLYKELSNGSVLDIANKAWVGNNTVILPAFQENLLKYFDVELGREDFSSDPESARKNINDWVENKTGHNIKDLFSPGSIEKVTQLVLANAVYFKGEWEKKFDINQTYEDDFYITKDNKVKVNYMFEHDKFSSAVDKEHKIQLLQLPYAGGVFSIVFAIPLAKVDDYGGIESFEDLSQVEANMKDKTKTLKKWIGLLPDMKKVSTEMDIIVPKFEMKLEVDLLSQLKKLGINDVFLPGTADLSGINGNKDLYVSSAVHKAFIKVDEEGTTAAAATGFAANMMMAMEPQECFLNHPFLFYIIHRESNAIIFSGKVQNPIAE